MRTIIRTLAKTINISEIDLVLGLCVLLIVLFAFIIITQWINKKRELKKYQLKNDHLIVANEAAIHEKVEIISSLQSDLQSEQRSKANEINDLNKRLVKRDRTIEELKSTISSNDNKIQKLTSSKAYLENLKEEQERIIREKEAINSTLTSKLERKEKENVELKSTLTKNKDEIKKLSLQDAASAKEYRALQQKYTEQSSVLDSVTKALQDKEQDYAQLATELAEKTQENDATSIELLNKDAELKLLSDELAEKRSAVESLRNDLLAKNKELDLLKVELERKSAPLDELQDQVEILKVEKEELQGSLEKAKSERERLIAEKEKKETTIAVLQEENRKLQAINEKLVTESDQESNHDSSVLDLDEGVVGDGQMEETEEASAEEINGLCEGSNQVTLDIESKDASSTEDPNHDSSVLTTDEPLESDDQKVEAEKQFSEDNGNLSAGDNQASHDIESNDTPLVITPTPEVVMTDLLPNLSGGGVNSRSKGIDTVIDVDNNREISASLFFRQPEAIIFKTRSDLEKAIFLDHPKYVCKYCGQMVRISGRKTERGMARFFSHLRDSDDCDRKTTTGRGKREIERIKYGKGPNEGERHKRVKEEIAHYLVKTEGVSDVQMEHYFKGNHPILKWRRPDICAKYKGQNIVFELQLSTTFASVITERDLFYRLNNTFIIWIFNFDEEREHVYFNNMMAKDIYYNNRMNVFLFDKDALAESESKGELVLKCNWLNPDKTWAKAFDSSSGMKECFFVTLKDLTYPDSYKPFYFDAETPFFLAHPEFRLSVKQIEEENKRIITDLDKRLEKEKQRSRIIEDEDITILDSTHRYILAKQGPYRGILSKDSTILIPFCYENISVYSDWCEGTINGLTDYYDKSFNIINTGVKSFEETGISGLQYYVKEVGGDYLKGLMDSSKRPITQAKYTEISTWSNDYFLARRDGFYCLLSKDGDETLSGYSVIGKSNPDGIISVTKDGRDFLIDMNGESVATKTISLNNGLFLVQKAGFWGVENEQKESIIPFEYDAIGTINAHLAGIKGSSVKQFEIFSLVDVPINVKYQTTNNRRMLVFRTGQLFALMNSHQQKKAKFLSRQTYKANELYISHVNEELGLVYLSAIPVYFFQYDDLEAGYHLHGEILKSTPTGLLIKEITSDRLVFIHKTILPLPFESYQIGNTIEIEKCEINKDFKTSWKIV